MSINCRINDGGKRLFNVPVQCAGGLRRLEVVEGPCVFYRSGPQFGPGPKRLHCKSGFYAKVPGWGWYRCLRTLRSRGDLVLGDCLPF